MDCMLKDESVLGHTNLFPPNEYEKNDKIVLKYFQQNLNRLNCFVMLVIKIEYLRKLKYHILTRKEKQ